MIGILQPYPFSPPKDGGTKFSFRFCEQLHQQTKIVCFSTSDNDLSYSPFRIIPLFENVKTRYFAPSLKRKVIDKCIDLGIKTLIINHPYMAPLIFPRARREGIKIVLLAHNIEYQRFKSMKKPWWPIIYLIEKWSMKYADMILFVSDIDKENSKAIFNLPSTKLFSAPYSISYTKPPANRQENRNQIRLKYGLSQNTLLLYFYGPMDYHPNSKALNLLLDSIVPALIDRQIDFLLFLSGKNIDTVASSKIERYSKFVKWLGFVDDFESMLQASDIMLNPIWLGGGVKIKLMEALANSVTAISFHGGALGIDQTTVENKLFVVPDEDAEAMADAIASIGKEQILQNTPNAFYEKYAAQNTIKRLLPALL